MARGVTLNLFAKAPLPLRTGWCSMGDAVMNACWHFIEDSSSRCCAVVTELPCRVKQGVPSRGWPSGKAGGKLGTMTTLWIKSAHD